MQNLRPRCSLGESEFVLPDLHALKKKKKLRSARLRNIEMPLCLQIILAADLGYLLAFVYASFSHLQ